MRIPPVEHPGYAYIFLELFLHQLDELDHIACAGGAITTKAAEGMLKTVPMGSNFLISGISIK